MIVQMTRTFTGVALPTLLLVSDPDKEEFIPVRSKDLDVCHWVICIIHWQKRLLIKK